MDTRALSGLLFLATWISVLFCVSSPCSVEYSSTCKCSDESLTNSERSCESLLSGKSTYINCFNMCVIPDYAFKNLPCRKCLETVYLRYNNISVIQPVAFNGLNKLSNLYIDHNEIQELNQSTFQHIRTLLTLDVSFNRLGYLHPEVFARIESFYFLNVSHNALVLNGTILNTEYLNILDAAYCNPENDTSWHVLKHPAFSGLPNLTKLVLEGNAIRCLMSDAFVNNQRLVELNLKNNMLQVMKYQFFLRSHIKVLHLSHNPLKCDCHMKTFSALCSNNSVKFDEVSCRTPPGAWELLEHLHCDNVPVTDSLDNGHCGFDMGSTNTVTTALKNSAGTLESNTTSAALSTTSANTVTTALQSSAGTLESNTTSAALSTTSEVVIRSLYIDKQSVTSAVASSSGSAVSLELLINPTTGMPSTHSQNPNITSIQAPLTRSSMWFIPGAMCFLVVTIVLVALITRVCRRQDIEGSVPATHYFKFQSPSSERGAFDKVNENYQPFRYIRFDSLHKIMIQKPDLHYFCRDVTNLTDMAPEAPSHGKLEIESSESSGILETDLDTLCTKVNIDGHVYEVVQ